MSDKDKAILERCEIPIDWVWTALGITRQAVAKGLEAAKDYFGDYSGFARLLKILEYMKRNKLPGIECLEKEIRKEHYELAASLEKHKSQLHLFSREPTNTDFDELWVFSAEPFEVKSKSYLNKMTDIYFCKSKYRIVYFCPHDWAEHLSKDLFYKLMDLIEIKACNFDELATVYVFECAATRLSPHFAIYNPREKAAGGVYVSNDTFAELYEEKCSEIVREVMTAGIGVNKDIFLPRYLHDNKIFISGSGIEFRIVFNSEELKQINKVPS